MIFLSRGIISGNKVIMKGIHDSKPPTKLQSLKTQATKIRSKIIHKHPVYLKCLSYEYLLFNKSLF